MGNTNIIKKLAIIQRDTLCAGQRDGSNPRFNSKYLTLDACLNTIKDALRIQNVVLTHNTEYEPDKQIVNVATTLVCAETCEKLDILGVMPVERPSAHGVQSAITYAKRSNLANLFGLSEPDDDANASVEDEKRGRGRPPGAKNKPKQSIAQQKRSDWPAFIDALRCAESDDEVEKIKTHALSMFPDMWAEPIMDLCQRTMLGEDIGEVAEPQQ